VTCGIEIAPKNVDEPLAESVHYARWCT
jgi:hypothetical protein